MLNEKMDERYILQVEELIAKKQEKEFWTVKNISKIKNEIGKSQSIRKSPYQLSNQLYKKESH